MYSVYMCISMYNTYTDTFKHIIYVHVYTSIYLQIYTLIMYTCMYHLYTYVHVCVHMFIRISFATQYYGWYYLWSMHTGSHLAKRNILHHSTIHKSTLQIAAAHYNSLHHCVVSHKSTPSATHRNIMRFHATCNILLKTSWIMRMMILCFDVCNIESWHIWLISNDGTQAGYNSGMGEIFRKVAEISSPAGVSRALPAGV